MSQSEHFRCFLGTHVLDMNMTQGLLNKHYAAELHWIGPGGTISQTSTLPQKLTWISDVQGGRYLREDFGCGFHVEFWPILDDRLKEKILKPWKGALSSHSESPSVRLFVCLCVCEQATGHNFWPRNLISGLSSPCWHEEKRIFLLLEIFIFTHFKGIFLFFFLL